MRRKAPNPTSADLSAEALKREGGRPRAQRRPKAEPYEPAFAEGSGEASPSGGAAAAPYGISSFSKTPFVPV